MNREYPKITKVHWFLKPVTGIADYSEHVKRPMDLCSIENKIVSSEKNTIGKKSECAALHLR